MHTLKLTRVGNSAGVIVPKEVLPRLKVVKSDSLHLTDTVAGVALTPHDPMFEEQLESLPSTAVRPVRVTAGCSTPRSHAH